MVLQLSRAKPGKSLPPTLVFPRAPVQRAHVYLNSLVFFLNYTCSSLPEHFFFFQSLHNYSDTLGRTLTEYRALNSKNCLCLIARTYFYFNLLVLLKIGSEALNSLKSIRDRNSEC